MSIIDCNSDYTTVGSNSVEECCDDYPVYCSSKLKKNSCSILNNYKHFVFETCLPDGWTQINDDCWLDSSLYSLFASEDTSRIFSGILDSLNVSEDEYEKKIALYISNYLNGLNNSEWSTTEECKQLCKNEITNALLSWNKSHEYALNIGEEAIQTEAFEKNISGNVGRGPQHILFKFFSLISKSNIDLIEPDGSEINSYCTNPKNKAIKAIIESISSKKTILIISLNNIDKDKCNDKTRITEITKKENYTLHSIVFGSGAHIISATLCNGRFISYDNMGDPRVKNNLINTSNSNYFIDAEQVILVYLKNSISGVMKSRTKRGTIRKSRTKSRKKRRTKRRTFNNKGKGQLGKAGQEGKAEKAGQAGKI